MLTTEHVTETAPHEFTGEASTLGMSPGHFPAMLKTDLGNGLPLLRQRGERNRDGELVVVHYKQECGCVTLKIFND